MINPNPLLRELIKAARARGDVKLAETLRTSIRAHAAANKYLGRR